MYRLQWDAHGEKFYEYGCDRGVLYVDGDGVVWNGLVSVEQSPSGGEAQSHYVDGFKYLTVSEREEFAGTITAVYSPPEFDACDGSATLESNMQAHQQTRRSFGFSYRTRIGNDLDPNGFGYRIHLVYNAVAAPKSVNYSTLSDAAIVTPLSWTFATTPVYPENAPPASHYSFDTTKIHPWGIKELEKILYGSEVESARMPEPDEVHNLLNKLNDITVYDNDDGETFTLIAPDSALMQPDEYSFKLTWPTAEVIDVDTYSISSN